MNSASAEDAATTAQLLDTAREALERYHDVHIDDDGALTFRHGDVPCALQGMRLAEGLAVLTLRYTFPASGLNATAMGPLLMLVVSTASQLRDELLTEAQST